MSNFTDFAQFAFWMFAGAIALIVLAAFAALIGIRLFGYIRSVVNDIKESDDSDSLRF